MSKSICSRIWLGAVAIGVASFVNAQAKTPDAGQSMLKARPSSFEKNVGQWDSRALFGGHSAGMDFWISKEGFVFQYQRTATDTGNEKFAGHTVGMLFEGAKPFTAVGSDEAGVREYMGGKNKSVAQKYHQVKMSGIYDNVDAVAYFDGKAPRYDFIVHPGANSDDIRFAFKGAAAKVVAKDKLQVKTVLGDRFQEGLFAYQMVNGNKVSVPVSFKQIDATHVGFNVGSYDKSKDLVIDPLVYGTYYGGDQGFDEVRGVAADADGNVYLTGYTRSAIYPVLYGPFGFNLISGRDAFVSRLTGDVYVHDYSALIPGSGSDDRGNYIRLDPLGNIWVVGSTNSTTICGDSNPGNIWILRFSLDPTTVLTPKLAGNPVFFRFGGPTATPNVTAITSLSMRPDSSAAPGATIRMMVTGLCSKTNGATGIVSGANNGSFYGTIDYNESTGFSVISGASGFVSASGSNTTTLTGASFDSTGNFFLSGALIASGNSDTAAGSPVFTTTSGVWLNGRLQRQKDIWVRKYDAAGTMTWSGLVGGAADDVTEGVFRTHSANVFDTGGSTLATDPQGNVYVLGRSNSFDFPRTSGVFGEIYQSGENYITVTKIKADGSQILYSTNIRNRGRLTASGLGVDSAGNAYITGVVSMTADLVPTFPDPIEPNSQTGTPGSIPLVNPIRAAYTFPTIPETCSNDGFLLILDSTASSIIRSTYIGGILDEGVFAPFVDPNGDVWVYGWTDTWRYYTVTNSTGTTTTERIPGGRGGGLDAGFITNLAFKQFPEPPSQPGILADPTAYFLTFNGNDFSGGSAGNLVDGAGIRYCRDGFILRFRESLPLISTMSLAPSPIPGGDPQGLANPPFSVGTITLSGPAPAGGATVKLTLDTPAAASFLPTSSTSTSTIIIPAGSTTGTYNLYSKVVTAPVNVQVKANYSGNLKTATVQVVPWLSTITINGSSIVGGNSTTATIKLSGNAPNGGVDVTISTDLPGTVLFPGGTTVTVPAGANQATFAINTNGVDVAASASINATLLGVTRTGTLGINVAKLTNIVLTPNPVAAGSSVTGVVNLDGKTGSAGSLNISINGNPAGYTITPSTVTIPANSNQSATFTITTPFEAADVARVVKAIRTDIPDGPVTATLNVSALLVNSITLNPDIIASGGSSTATVSLTSAAPAGGARVLVSSNKPGIAVPVDGSGVPISEVLVPAGDTQVTFNVQGLFALNGDENVIISAYRGPSPQNNALVKSATLKVLALTYTMTITPNSVFGGQNATGKIVLSAPAIPGFAMNTVTCDDPLVTFSQPVFTTGNDTATFSITTPVVTDTRTVTFSASAGTLAAVTATLTIKATEVVSVKILPKNTVRQNSTIQIQVKVNRLVPVATPGKITFSNASLLVLPIGQNYVNFTVPLGSDTATVTLTTRRIPRNLSTQVTATVSPTGTGATASTTLFVII